MYKIILSLLVFIFVFTATAQEIPLVYTNIGTDEKGVYVFLSGRKVYAEKPNDAFQFINFHGNPVGHALGIDLDFKFPKLNGTLYFGFINYDDAEMPQTVFFRRSLKIKDGKTSIDIEANLSGRYDMIGWEQSGKGVLGYRIVNNAGKMLYDGKLAFSKNEMKFKVEPTIIEGPFINKLSSNSVLISFTTTQEIKASVKVNGKSYKDKNVGLKHEILIDGLKPNTVYDYMVQIKKFKFNYEFETAPAPGSRTKFTFAYASDSRAGMGGGERDIFGTNAYIMKRIGYPGPSGLTF